MTGHYDRQWASAEIKPMRDSTGEHIALVVGGEIIALMEPAKLKHALRLLDCSR